MTPAAAAAATNLAVGAAGGPAGGPSILDALRAVPPDGIALAAGLSFAGFLLFGRCGWRTSALVVACVLAMGLAFWGGIAVLSVDAAGRASAKVVAGLQLCYLIVGGLGWLIGRRWRARSGAGTGKLE